MKGFPAFLCYITLEPKHFWSVLELEQIIEYIV